MIAESKATFFSNIEFYPSSEMFFGAKNLGNLVNKLSKLVLGTRED